VALNPFRPVRDRGVEARTEEPAGMLWDVSASKSDSASVMEATHSSPGHLVPDQQDSLEFLTLARVVEPQLFAFALDLVQSTAEMEDRPPQLFVSRN
jgi:hypothetical protein